MTDQRVRPATPATPGSGRQAVITVVVLDKEFSGALAYALDYALFRPAAVRAVRVPPSAAGEHVSPIPVQDLSGSPAVALMRLSSSSERMVAQCGRGDTSRHLAELRQNTHSPLVEVDENGIVLRFSDPRGWSMPHGTYAAG
jgi:hypothetical protein